MKIISKSLSVIRFEESMIFKFILFFLILSISATTVFGQAYDPSREVSAKMSALLSQSGSGFDGSILDETQNYDPTYELPIIYGLSGLPATQWTVAEHINGLWRILAIDVVSGDILTGISASNLAVVRDGLEVGTFTVNAKFGYGTGLNNPATVGVACSIDVSFSGFPSIGRAFVRYHIYKF